MYTKQNKTKYEKAEKHTRSKQQLQRREAYKTRLVAINSPIIVNTS